MPPRAAPAPPAYAEKTAAPRPSRPSLRRRVVGAFTVLLVPGILVGTSIPAFAVGASSGVDAGSGSFSSDGQSLIVDSAAGGFDASRASFKATTPAELAAQKLAAEQRSRYQYTTQQSAQASSGDYSTVTPRQAGDDYPWRNGAGLSPLGYVIRQCTDFVAWRLNRDAGYTSHFKYVWSVMTPGGGSASQWASAWRSNGWKTSHKPVKGSVAWFYGNHVAYVKSVNDDGSVNLEEYNWGGDGAYHTRTVDVDEVALYLYPPP